MAGAIASGFAVLYPTYQRKPGSSLVATVQKNWISAFECFYRAFTAAGFSRE